MAISQELVFAPEVTSLTFSFTVLNDDVVEDIESVQLVLTEGRGERGVVFPEGGVVSGLIQDDNDSKQKSFGCLSCGGRGVTLRLISPQKRISGGNFTSINFGYLGQFGGGGGGAEHPHPPPPSLF